MSERYEVRDGVAVITMDTPPVNSLGLANRRFIAGAMQRALADAAVHAVVLTGAGRGFCGGADIREFGFPEAMAQPHLLNLIDLIEQAGKPVVAAIHGVVMGGGLELAMGCHYRVVTPGTQVALPEVKLGLLPGGSGTQRLPRLLGVETALNMIVTGVAMPAERLAAQPGQRLFDRLVEQGDVVDAAVALAREVAQRRPLPRVRDLRASHPNPDGYFQFARNTLKASQPHYPAPLRNVDCVEMAVQAAYDEGLAEEHAGFMALLDTPQSKALRHAFFGERAAAKIPDVPEDTPKRKIERVAVIGAGTMGGGISMNFLNAGIPVTILEMSQEAIDRGVGVMRKNYEAQVKKGKLKQDKYEQRMALLTTTTRYDDLKDADLVIEAVFEELGVKEKVFRQLDAVMKPGAILASNTSTLDVDKIAAFTQRPQDVVGLHFFSPAHVMKLLEVVRGEQTAPEVLATAMAFGKTLRKTCVVSGVCDGFIGNRMLDPYFRQAAFLLEEGCSPQQVDRAIEAFGFPMGPFRMSDMAGNDIGWAIRKRHYVEKPQVRHSRLPDRLCELGRFGQKSGAGWYDYRPGQRDGAISPVVNELIEQHRASLGLAPRKVSNEEIVQRLVLALVNEGARILEEGVAARAGDIDMVYLTGYGFPAWRGGPMHWAEQQGLYAVAQTMRRFASAPHGDADFWQPAPLIARLATEGGRFHG